MATKAFVLIETVVGKTKAVKDALQKIEEIKSVDAVTGPYDIIAVVEGDNLTAMGSLITTKIHPVNGVSRTVSCLAIRIA